MCGIAGIVHCDRSRTVNKTLLEKMTSVVSHRGPDGQGLFVSGNVGLGHRRLAIIDLSTGDQPMSSADGNLVVIFNGEIYNYVELRAELKTKGHAFRTTSDTEVILKAYEEWGVDCQNRFNGMWAFALWDRRQQQLLVSRDRIGEKPLHFAVQDNSFLFGSEIKSILAYGGKFPMARELLDIYLSFGFIPAPYTIYKGISKLLPGHFLLVKEGKVNQHCYWNLPAITEKDMRRDEKNIYEEFERYFADSVRIRMRCDVPYGAFLSGGLDSSSIVAAMSEAGPAVSTFTIGFAQKAFDERHLARQVAEKFKTNHQEEMVEPELFQEALDKVTYHFDEPFGDASAMPVGMVSRLARRKVTVVLTGDGGDEVLSGYTSYVTEKVSGLYRSVPKVMRTAVGGTVGLLSGVTRNSLRYRFNRLDRFLRLSGKSFEDRFSSKLSLLDRNSVRELIPGTEAQFALDDYLSQLFSECRFTTPFYRLMYYNLKVSLPDDMLTKVDRMSMAHSLETRVPFLDHRLVELAWCVDKSVKLPGLKLKNVLKQTYGKKLPPDVLNAPKKSFSVPLRDWFKQKSFENSLQDLEFEDFGLNSKVIKKIVAANNSSEHDYGDFIWRLFVLKNWIRN